MNLLRNLIHNKKLYVIFGLIFLLLLLIVAAMKSGSDYRTPGYLVTPENTDNEEDEVPIDDEQRASGFGSKEELQDMMEGERAFSENMRRMLEEYPWYNELPIMKEDYAIFYDFSIERFLIVLNLSSTAPQEEQNRRILRALEDIRGLGVEITEDIYRVRYNR